MKISRKNQTELGTNGQKDKVNYKVAVLLKTLLPQYYQLSHIYPLTREAHDPDIAEPIVQEMKYQLSNVPKHEPGLSGKSYSWSHIIFYKVVRFSLSEAKDLAHR